LPFNLFDSCCKFGNPSFICSVMAEEQVVLESTCVHPHFRYRWIPKNGLNIHGSSILGFSKFVKGYEGVHECRSWILKPLVADSRCWDGAFDVLSPAVNETATLI